MLASNFNKKMTSNTLAVVFVVVCQLRILEDLVVSLLGICFFMNFMHKQQASCSGVDEAFVVHSTLFSLLLKNWRDAAFNHCINIAFELHFVHSVLAQQSVSGWIGVE